MALPSSGQISFQDVANELDLSLNNVDIRTMSALLNKTTPDSISEFYGYNNIVTNGLVLYLDAGQDASYPNSGTTWYDLSGNGDNLPLVNGPTYNSSNLGSIVFDGSNDYAGKTTSNYNILGTSAYSFSIWIYFEPGSSGVDSRFFWRGQYQILVFKYSDNTLNFYMWNNTDTAYVVNIPSSEYSFSTWINLSGTISNSTLKLYLNSVLKNSTSITGTIGYSSRSTTRLSVGADLELSFPANCRISQVLDYSRELSSTEVTQNYNALKGRYGL